MCMGGRQPRKARGEGRAAARSAQDMEKERAGEGGDGRWHFLQPGTAGQWVCSVVVDAFTLHPGIGHLREDGVGAGHPGAFPLGVVVAVAVGAGYGQWDYRD